VLLAFGFPRVISREAFSFVFTPKTKKIFKMYKLQFATACSVVCCLLIGCAAPTNPNAPAKVKGKVTYKNEPVTAGTLTFHTDNAGVYSMMIGPDGSFSGTDLPAQEFTLTVDTEAHNPNRKKQVYGGGSSQSSPPPGGANPAVAGGAYVKIPAKYAKKQSSDLKITLTNGEQIKNIELSD
jgi:hypothetical protein